MDGGKFEGESAERKEEEMEEEKGRESGSWEGSRAAEVTVNSRYPCNPPHKNYVARKAYDYGARVEVLDLKEMNKTPEVEHLLWQMPKAFPHKVNQLTHKFCYCQL